MHPHLTSNRTTALWINDPDAVEEEVQEVPDTAISLLALDWDNVLLLWKGFLVTWSQEEICSLVATWLCRKWHAPALLQVWLEQKPTWGHYLVFILLALENVRDFFLPVKSFHSYRKIYHFNYHCNQVLQKVRPGYSSLQHMHTCITTFRSPSQLLKEL